MQTNEGSRFKECCILTYPLQACQCGWRFSRHRRPLCLSCLDGHHPLTAPQGYTVEPQLRHNIIPPPFLQPHLWPHLSLHETPKKQAEWMMIVSTFSKPSFLPCSPNHWRAICLGSVNLSSSPSIPAAVSILYQLGFTACMIITLQEKELLKERIKIWH